MCEAVSVRAGAGACVRVCGRVQARKRDRKRKCVCVCEKESSLQGKRGRAGVGAKLSIPGFISASALSCAVVVVAAG